MPDPIPEEDDDEKYFGELLEKKGTTWLKTQLEALGFKANPQEPNPTNPQPPAGDFAAFLLGENQAAKKSADALREKLEAVLEILTPEQRTLLKSAGQRADPPLPKPNEQPAPPAKKSLRQKLARL